MKRLFLFTVLAALTAALGFGQVSVGAGIYSGTAWGPAPSTTATNPLAFVPIVHMYCYNVGLGQWVPADSNCFGGAASSYPGVTTDGANGLNVVGGVSVGTLVRFPDSTTQTTAYSTGAFAYSGLTEFGDSITAGNGATVSTNGYASLMLPDFGGATNFGNSGDFATDLSFKVLHNLAKPHYYDTPAVTALIGTNDSQACGATCVTNFQLASTGAYVFAATPQEYQIYFGTNVTSAVSTTGVWSQDSSFFTNSGLTTTTNGATLTWTTFTPSKYMVLAWDGAAGNTSTGALSCDSGALVDTIATAGSGAALTFNTATVAALGKLYTFAAATTHTCTLTITAGVSNAFTAIYAATPPPATFSNFGSPTANGPKVFVGGVLRQVATSNPWAETNAVVTAAFDTAAASTVASLRAAGFAVQFVNVRNYITIPQDMSGAITNLNNGLSCPASTQVGLHPNDCGHRHLADAFLEAAQPVGASYQNQSAPLLNPPIINSPNATSTTSWINADGLFTLPTTADLGHGVLLGSSKSGGLWFDYGIANLEFGSTFTTTAITPTNGQLRYCTYTTISTHITAATALTSCPFIMDGTSGKLTTGLITAPASGTGYHQFGQNNLASTTALNDGISLYDHTNLNFGIQMGFHDSQFATELIAPNSRFAGFAFYDSTGGEPTGQASFSHPFYCSDTLCLSAVPFSSKTMGTTTNCSSAASPAVCSAAPSGSVVVAAAATTVVVNTTAVTAASQIKLQEDSSLGTKLSVTCNTTTGRLYTVSARTAATSFTITSSAAPTTNPACLSYSIVN